MFDGGTPRSNLIKRVEDELVADVGILKSDAVAKFDEPMMEHESGTTQPEISSLKSVNEVTCQRSNGEELALCSRRTENLSMGAPGQGPESEVMEAVDVVLQPGMLCSNGQGPESEVMEAVDVVLQPGMLCSNGQGSESEVMEAVDVVLQPVMLGSNGQGPESEVMKTVDGEMECIESDPVLVDRLGGICSMGQGPMVMVEQSRLESLSDSGQGSRVVGSLGSLEDSPVSTEVNHDGIAANTEMLSGSFTWVGEKQKYMKMSRGAKRDHYRCGDGYFGLIDVPTWRVYADENNLNQPRSEWSWKNEPPDDYDLDVRVSVWMGDVTALEIDVIVNAANKTLLGGGGVDGAIHQAAGPFLKDECATFDGCQTGDVKATGGYCLPATHVIHTVGPTDGDEELLSQCYRNSLDLMLKIGQRTIAFPCIATGVYGFPREKAAHVAVKVVKEFLDIHRESVDRIVFCLFEPDDVELYVQAMLKYFSVTAAEKSEELNAKSSGDGPAGHAPPVDVFEEDESKPPDLSNDADVLRRGLPNLVGVYIEGLVQGEEITYTVDSGATTTVLSHKAYLRIPDEKRPELQRPLAGRMPATADGRSMKFYGVAPFQIELGPLRMDLKMTVADITDDALLGADVLQQDPSGPADLILSEDVMLFKGLIIPVKQVGSDYVRNVRCADYHIIPRMSEVLVDAFVDRAEDGNGDDALLVEPRSSLAEKYAIVVAPCLVDIRRLRRKRLICLPSVVFLSANRILKSYAR